MLISNIVCIYIYYTNCIFIYSTTVVQRDPITGLGTLPKEHIEFGRTRNSSTGRPGLNTTLISWDVDSATICKNNGHTTKKPKRKSTLYHLVISLIKEHRL
ncbi:hypothetical protein KSF78_0005652 [Schistosoma japonicum]|nr:hypothetical protein KSF78_0005652 [Schistosoma japonicum]